MEASPQDDAGFEIIRKVLLKSYDKHVQELEITDRMIG